MILLKKILYDTSEALIKLEIVNKCIVFNKMYASLCDNMIYEL